MSISAPDECADQIDNKLPKLDVEGSSPFARSVLICDAPENEYFSWPLINASKLKKLLESPIAYRDIYIEKTATIAESDAFRFGKIIHSSWQLGNEDFYSRSEDATGKEVTATGALSASGRVRERELAEEGKFLLTPQDHEKLNGIRRNALELPLVQQLLENRTAAEFNIRCSINGHACKGRIDLATPDGFADWKTTRDPRPLTDFPRSAMKFGYDLQAAFYNLLGQQAGGLITR